MSTVAIVETALSLREEIAIELRTHLDTIGQSYLSVGKLLKEARGDFENQAEFLEWVKSEFGIMKSQAFNYMKVFTVFGESETFKGVALRVLTSLSPYVEDKAVMERAEAAHKAGNLTATTIGKVITPIEVKATPAPTLPAQAANDSGTQPQAPANKTQETAAGIESAPVDGLDDAPPFEIDVKLGDDNAPLSLQTVPAAPTATSEREAGLMSLVETLRATIAEMQADIRKQATERESRIKAAPMLPQFKSKCLYARLGLSQEESQDAKAVNKAKRELVKLGYGADHQAWAAISEAVEALTAK